MKKFSYLLPFLFVALSSSLVAQTDKKTNNSQVLEKEPSDAKLKYVNSQSYLSSSSLVDYNSYYGDSLKGFQESKIKNEMLSKGVEGWEVAMNLNFQKRQFVNEKYNLVKKAELPPLQVAPQNLGGVKKLGGAMVSATPCINEGFEAMAPGVYTGLNSITGWTLEARNCSGTGQVCQNNYTPGCSFGATILTTPFTFASQGVGTVPGIVPNSPLGGTKVIRLNNALSGDLQQTRIRQSFLVTQNNSVYQFAYAGYWQDPGTSHGCCDKPGLAFKMYDCSGNSLACSSLSLFPGATCQNTPAITYSLDAGGNPWCNWQLRYVDLTPYIGGCVTVEIMTSDCSQSGHWGTTFFDSNCSNQLLPNIPGLSGTGNNIAGPVSFCAGSNIAQISAPLGYASYQWVAPTNPPTNVAAPQGTMSTLSVSNPIPGSVYTVNLTSPSGCQYVATNTIVFTQVNVAGIGSNSTCANGASGSATVVGNGSGSGYSYQWLNSTGSVVSTASAALNLPAGPYTVNIAGLGAAGCGSASAQTTIDVAPPGVLPVFKPYCGTQAFLITAGGSNFKWYNGLTLIPPPLGTASSYTVNNPTNGSIYRLSYLSSQGCQDSVEFTLNASTPGAIAMQNVSWVCPGGSNGTAVISMTPAPAAPPGVNSFTTTNANASTPIYNSGINPTVYNSYSLTGLSAGSYSVSAFDGSCKYTTSFNVSAFVYNYTVTPVTATLCQGNTIPANITFTSAPTAGQYTYSWSPATFLLPGTTNQQNTFVSPTVAVGQSLTTVYTVVVTPSVVNCPITKTISISVVNPPVPVISAIPNMCDNGTPYTITANPPGGSFITGITGTANPINGSGVLNPGASGNVLGTNTFTYSIAINTCIATQTATYQVSHFNSAVLTSSVPPLCVNNPNFNLMNIVQSSANGTWTAQNGGVFSSGPGSFVFNPSNLITGSYPITYSTTSNPNPTVCPAVSNLTVAVTKTLSPTIVTPTNNFCTNSATFALSASPSGGSFFGSPCISGSGVVTPSLLFLGAPSVCTYTLADGPCVNTANINLQFSQFNSASFSGVVPEQCGNSNVSFNLMSIVQNTANGSWIGPNNAVIPSSTFTPFGMLTGSYIYKYSRSSTPNATLCPDSKTIAVSVLNPTIPTISQAGPFCSKDGDVQLTVTPNTGHWSTSAYLSNSGVFSPSLGAIGNNPVQYVVGTNTCFAQHTKLISVEAFAPATITHPIPDQCNTGSPTNLQPFTMSSNGLWVGAGISGTNFNPTNAGAGNFVLTYKTSSSPSGLCPDQSTVAVNVYSLAPPVLTRPSARCNNSDPVQLVVTPVGGLFAGTNNSAVTYKGLFNPGLGVIGDNVINYSVAVGPCVAYAQTTVTVEKFISADLDHMPKKAIYCQTIDDGFNLDDLVQNRGGAWQTNSGGLVGHNFDPTSASVGSNNTYTYFITSPSGICSDSSAVRIKVGAIPKVAPILNTPASGCVPFQAAFNNPSSDVGTGEWIMGDGSEPVKELDVKYVYTKPGTYTATLKYVSSEGCPAEPYNSVPITVYEVPVANFSFPDEVLISNPEIQLTNLSTSLGNNTYRWKISGLYDINDKVNPSIVFPKVGKYPVTLIAESANGKCTNEITKTIEVKTDFNIFIPSSFSPNFDNINDVFIPVFSEYGLDLKSYEMEIFDRWGHSLFRTKDYTKGWDGSVKGEALKEEVYVYKIKYRDLDGNLYSKIGHLSLIK